MTNHNSRQKLEAIDRFIARKGAIDDLLARMSALSEDHFGTSPDTITWSHVATLQHIEEKLREICAFSNA